MPSLIYLDLIKSIWYIFNANIWPFLFSEFECLQKKFGLKKIILHGNPERYDIRFSVSSFMFCLCVSVRVCERVEERYEGSCYTQKDELSEVRGKQKKRAYVAKSIFTILKYTKLGF